MPVYEIDGPDGKTYEIEGPPGATREQIIAKVTAGLQPQAPPHQAQQQAQKPNALVDSLRTIPGGLAQGLAGLAGLPGDIESGLTAGADWALGKMGADVQGMQQKREAMRAQAIIPRPPTSSQINKAISEPFGGYYEPKTETGEYTRTVAQFAPAALAPGSALIRFARAAVPGVASETAGQMAKGKPYEPLARAGGALLGGVGLGMAEGARSAVKTPTMEELGKLKSATYKAAEQQGVTIAAPVWQKFAGDVAAKLKGKPFRGDLHPNATSALKTLLDEPGDVTLENADAIRQVIGDAIESASKNTNKGDLARSSEIKGMLDDFLDNLSPTETLSGDAAVAVPLLKEARSLAQREFKAKEIEKLIDLAENSASSAYSQSGVEQALRAQFKNFNAKLIKDPTLAKSFSDAERAAIKKVAEGGPVGNVLRYFGKLAPTGVVSGGLGSGIGAGIGAAVGGVPGAVVGGAVAPMLGGMSRAGATLATNRNAQLAAELMRRGPQAAGVQNPSNSAAAIANLLLSQQGAR